MHTILRSFCNIVTLEIWFCQLYDCWGLLPFHAKTQTTPKYVCRCCWTYEKNEFVIVTTSKDSLTGSGFGQIRGWWYLTYSNSKWWCWSIVETKLSFDLLSCREAITGIFPWKGLGGGVDIILFLTRKPQ